MGQPCHINHRHVSYSLLYLLEPAISTCCRDRIIDRKRNAIAEVLAAAGIYIDTMSLLVIKLMGSGHLLLDMG